MALQTWKCLECNKTFKVGEWKCADGGNHKVEPKTFRSLDAPVAPGRYEGTPPVVRGKTTVCNIPPPHKEMEGMESRWVGEGSVEFINGVYITDDPEKQYYLEKKGPGYNATEEQWNAVWLTSDEKLAKKEMELRAREQRLENDRNVLLEKTKAKVKSGDLQHVQA